MSRQSYLSSAVLAGCLVLASCAASSPPAAIPDDVRDPTPERIVDSHVEGELLVFIAVDSEDPDGDAIDLANEFEGEVVGKVGSILLYQMYFEGRDKDALRRIEAEMEALPLVDEVGLNYAEGPPRETPIEDLTPAVVPDIDEVFAGDYDAWVNLMPVIPESGPGVVVVLPGEDVNIVDGWFLPEGLPPLRGVVADGRLRPDFNLYPMFDENLPDNYEPRTNSATMDLVLEIEDRNGVRAVVSIDDAVFDFVS